METIQLRNQLGAEQRRLSGFAVQWGEISPSHQERFLPGSLRPRRAVSFNLSHRPLESIAHSPGGGLSVSRRERGLWMEATIPETPAGDEALRRVVSGEATGLSVEFFMKRDRTRGGIREIQDAELSGIGLVADPSYETSRVQLRRRASGMRSRVRSGSWASCDCIGGGGEVRFEESAIDDMAAQVERAAASESGPDVLAVFKNYASPVASARRGTLFARRVEDGLDVDITLPSDGPAVDQLTAAAAAAGLLVRPLLNYDDDDADFSDEERGRVVRRARLRAFLIGSTDRVDGWDFAELRHTTTRRKNNLWWI